MKYNTLSIIGIVVGILIFITSLIKYYIIYENPSMCGIYCLMGISFIVSGIIYQHIRKANESEDKRKKEIEERFKGIDNKFSAYGDKLQDYHNIFVEAGLIRVPDEEELEIAKSSKSEDDIKGMADEAYNLQLQEEIKKADREEK